MIGGVEEKPGYPDPKPGLWTMCCAGCSGGRRRRVCICGAKRNQGIDITEKETYDVGLYTEHDCTATGQIFFVDMGEKG